tara:strand:+ start:30334 stop:31371 length:1038 start_codon:yes stop_codon:yes gene_type:complete
MKTFIIAASTTLAIVSCTLPAQDQDLADVFDRVHASVVTITATAKARGGGPAKGLPDSRVGSGVLLSLEGSILTAAHVVDLADEIQVEFSDRTVMSARIVSVERGSDLALLQLENPLPQGATIAKLGDSDTVRVGNRIFIIGAPFDLRDTLTVGHISARRKDESFLGSMRHIEHFQTDAAIQRGNSGGPMFNMKGEVIGTVSHQVSISGANEGFGFGVTSNVTRDLLLNRGRVWLGFDALPMSLEMSQAVNVPDGQTGILVQRVAESSPAERLGLRGGTIRITVAGREFLLGGDVILEMLGRSLSSPDEASAAAKATRALRKGDRLAVKVLRAGKVIELATLLGR